MKDALSHRQPKWPLMGYAPGDYMVKCFVCGEQVMGVDKRSIHCLPCAIDQANERAINVRDALVACREENHTLRSAIQIVSDGATTSIKVGE